MLCFWGGAGGCAGGDASGGGFAGAVTRGEDQSGGNGAQAVAEYCGGCGSGNSGEGRTADAVSSALAQKSQTLLDYLRQQVTERLRTEDVAFQPQVESVRGTDRIVGYSGSANVSFRITPDKLGTVLAGSLEHGANTVSQTQFSPLESEVEAARGELELEGTKTALARAHAIAEAVGLRVVRVEQITVAAEENVVPMGGFAVGKAEAAAPARAIEERLPENRK